LRKKRAKRSLIYRVRGRRGEGTIFDREEKKYPSGEGDNLKKKGGDFITSMGGREGASGTAG